MNTDWGDNGHWQYLSFSYPGFVYGAGLSWCVEENTRMKISDIMDLFIFRDKSCKAGQLILDMGNYYLMEKVKLRGYTGVARILYATLEDPKCISDFTEKDFDDIIDYVTSLENRIQELQMHSNDAALIEEELKNACRFIVHGCRVGILKIHIKNGRQHSELEKQLVH